MEDLKEKLKDILEVENLNMNSKFSDFEEWDSLTTLTLISVIDTDYGITLNKESLESFNNLNEFCEFIIKNGK